MYGQDPSHVKQLSLNNVCKIGLRSFVGYKKFGENYLAVDLVLDGGALGDLHVDAHLFIHRPAGGLRDCPGYRPAKHTKVRVAICLTISYNYGWEKGIF